MKYKQNCYTLKTLSQLPIKDKKVLLLNVDSESIRFLIDCVTNLILGNLTGVKKSDVVRFRPIITKLYNKRSKTFRKEQRKLFASTDGVSLIVKLTPFIFERFC